LAQDGLYGRKARRASAWRFNKPFLKAKSLLDEGALGKILRMESAWHNLFDAGTHWLDMLFYFNNDTPADWALGQIDARGGKKAFGAYQASHGLVTFRFQNGVRATYHCGRDYKDLGCMIRVFGDKGVVEILEQEPWLRVHFLERPGWEIIDTGETIHDDWGIYRGIADLVESLESGRPPLLSADNAIRATEIIFAAHESSRRRERVDLPLPPCPSPLLTMIDKGEVRTEG